MDPVRVIPNPVPTATTFDAPPIVPVESNNGYNNQQQQLQQQLQQQQFQQQQRPIVPPPPKALPSTVVPVDQGDLGEMTPTQLALSMHR